MRVQVNLSDEMVVRVDSYAQKMGVSRSALCSMLIGQGIMSYDKSMDILSILGEKIGDNMLADKQFEEIGSDLKSQTK